MTLSFGPYPTHEQLTGGTTLFVDLTEEGELQPYDHLLAPGVRHVRFPIPDFDVPGEEQMVATLDAIDAALGRGEVVYVHCFAGRGRAPTVIGCHRRRHGLDPLRDPETAEQRAFVRAWQRGR